MSTGRIGRTGRQAHTFCKRSCSSLLIPGYTENINNPPTQEFVFKIEFETVRLDIAVSKGMNHLLKAPFVIHPKTGRVCVPFRITKVDSFDPEKVGFFHQH